MKKLFLLFALSFFSSLSSFAAHAPKSDKGLFLSPGQHFDYVMYGYVWDSESNTYDVVFAPGFVGGVQPLRGGMSEACTNYLKRYVSSEWYSNCFSMVPSSCRFANNTVTNYALVYFPTKARENLWGAGNTVKESFVTAGEFVFEDMPEAYSTCGRFVGDNLGKSLGGWLTPPLAGLGILGASVWYPMCGIGSVTVGALGGIFQSMLAGGCVGCIGGSFLTAGGAVAGSVPAACLHSSLTPGAGALFSGMAGTLATTIEETWNLAVVTPCSFLEPRPSKKQDTALMDFYPAYRNDPRDPARSARFN
ncbi:hypothetical protein IKW72_01680 [bacterium]|nr:hypothetical protein [bacterium]